MTPTTTGSKCDELSGLFSEDGRRLNWFALKASAPARKLTGKANSCMASLCVSGLVNWNLTTQRSTFQ
eukprot:CAMPEP_0172876228 /NCGR_PEP_ID=MMETSP1075-20121228/103777_1 /TAXON_ID=2916 /ORGANISM="Ceratium fusus, Strain PA161109" /LENGTH=67 /DNA_ID=CAMNT_0013727503 /DNA_START=84 /DNA_END=284 /DNA_ORIENTATION=-